MLQSFVQLTASLLVFDSEMQKVISEKYWRWNNVERVTGDCRIAAGWERT